MSMFTRLFFAFLFVCILSSGCCRFTRTDSDPAALPHAERIEKNIYPVYNIRGQEKPRSIQQMMQDCKVAGLSMAFIDNGKIAWTKCYGYADLEDSVKITPYSIFRAASLSKPLTAMAALHMVEEGKLSLDQDINLQLKGWKLPESEYTRDTKVTVAQLIGHSSGIKNDMHPSIPANEKLPALEDIFSGKTANAPIQLISVPGEKQKYSNSGYMLLSELLSDVSGKEFPQLMKEIIFKPCGMKSSTFEQKLPASFQRRIAKGYDENLKELSFYQHASAGAGALWTTPSDLGNFLAEILNSYHARQKSGKIISRQMAGKVFAETKDKLGFNKYIENGNFVFRNDGSIPGYNCTFMGSLYKNQALVIMLNTGSEKAYDLLNYLWRSVSLEYDWGLFEPEFYDLLPVSGEKLLKFEGIYANQKDTLSINFHDTELKLSSSADAMKTLLPVGANSFLLPEIPRMLYFKSDSSGTVKKLYIRNERGDQEPVFTRLER